MRASACDLEERRRGAETKVDTYPEPQKKNPDPKKIDFFGPKLAVLLEIFMKLLRVKT